MSQKGKLDISAPSFTLHRNNSAQMTTPQMVKANGKSHRKQMQQQHTTHHQNKEPQSFGLNLDEEVLAGNVKIKGRRAQVSISHLLDFSLPQRDIALNSKPPATRRRRKSSQHHEEGVHLVGQEFINANFRFVVDARGDYTPQTMDPNMILDDRNILRVIVPGGHQCPICLSEEICAPRMISCGHIFCHTCLLRFLDSEPITKKEGFLRKLRDCPLCSLVLRPKETKFVLIDETLNTDTPHIGREHDFKLIARNVDGILPIPYDLHVDRKELGDIPWYSDSILYPYARIMFGGLRFALDCLERDKQAIIQQDQLDKAIYGENNKYVQQALDEIDERFDLYEYAFHADLKEPNPLATSMEQDPASQNTNYPELNEANTYFFYQTCFNSSTKYFLSPLDVKVLIQAFGSFSNFPPRLSLKIESIRYGHTVNMTVLKRMKFLSHLPIGTEFAFVEIDWKNNIDPEVYHKFSKELNERRKKHASKVKREDHDKRRYEFEQDQKTKQFYMQENNGWGSYDFLDSKPGHVDLGLVTSMTSVANDATEAESSNDTGDTRGGAPPESSSATSAENSSGYTTTVWGTKILKGSAIITESDYDDDPFNTEELLNALHNSAKNSDAPANNGKVVLKKKKKKVVLLSSNGGSRGS